MFDIDQGSNRVSSPKNSWFTPKNLKIQTPNNNDKTKTKTEKIKKTKNRKNPKSKKKNKRKSKVTKENYLKAFKPYTWRKHGALVLNNVIMELPLKWSEVTFVDDGWADSMVLSLFLKKLLKSSFYLDLDLLLATIAYKPLHSIDTIQDDATTFVLFDVASDDHLAHKLSSFNVDVGPHLSLLDTVSQHGQLL